MKKLFFVLTMITMMVSCMSPEHQNTIDETMSEESVVDTMGMDSTLVDEMEFVSDEFEVTE